MKLTPTNRTDYGIRALIYLANHQGSHAKAADIGSAMGIPTGFLQQVLQELQRARLVSSRSGPLGGYLLARAPEDITILEIVETLEGPIGTSECALAAGRATGTTCAPCTGCGPRRGRALSDSLRAATLARVAADDRALAEGRASVPADSHRRRPG